MPRDLFLELAHRGLRMPIGTDLVLQELSDPEACKHDADPLGRVVEQTARRFNTPLAFPLMDLTLEKSDLLAFLAVPPAEVEQFHFSEPPSLATVSAVVDARVRPFERRIQANQGAIHFIAQKTDLVPVGMVIGPFSLMTKLVANPIVPVAMAGAGTTAVEDPGVSLVERCMALAEATVMRSVEAQIAAGARAMIVCEPAANSSYISPRQLRSGSDILERFVLAPNRRVRERLVSQDVDLIFHDCGELTIDLVRQLAHELRPAMMSLGSSRRLWEDASVVDKDIVLFGNLPTKTFYSDAAMPLEEVRRLSCVLLQNMRACGHPYILGSECDVLHVADAAETIRRKVDAMLTCEC